MNPRFDAYTATGRGWRAEDVVPALVVAAGQGVRIVEGKGHHQFAKRWSVRDEAGEVGSVQWGGAQGDWVMVEAKGEGTPQVVERLRRDFPHRCTRVDSCADFEGPGAFEALLRAVLDVKREHGLYGDRGGDWDDHPELGRTQYLGARSSAVRARLYEKGKQPEYAHLARWDWCRVEVQVRPQKEARERFAQVSALEVWGAGRWSRDLAARVLEQEVARAAAGTVHRERERDRALRWMVQQYGAHLVSLACDLGGFDVLGLTLGEMIEEERQRRRLRPKAGGAAL